MQSASIGKGGVIVDDCRKGVISNKELITQTNDRDLYIDAIRVFAICMVIMLHCVCDFYSDMFNSEKISWWIMGYINETGRIGVPLFFMISGFLLLNSSTASDAARFYKRRFRKILVPFILCDLFYYIYYVIINEKPPAVSLFLKELIDNGSAYHLWFIYTLGLLYLFVPYIKIILERVDLKMLVLFLLLVLFQSTIKPFLNIVLDGRATIHLADDGIVGYMGYMILGYILGTYKIKKAARYCILCIGISAISIFPLINSLIAYKTWSMPFNGGYMINHYAEAAMIFVFFKNMDYKTFGVKLKALADLCMSVYFVHVFVLERIKAGLAHIANLSGYLYYLILVGGTVIASFSIAYLLSILKKYFRRIKE